MHYAYHEWRSDLDGEKKQEASLAVFWKLLFDSLGATEYFHKLMSMNLFYLENIYVSIFKDATLSRGNYLLVESITSESIAPHMNSHFWKNKNKMQFKCIRCTKTEITYFNFYLID